METMVAFATEQIRADMAAKGWIARDLARAADLSDARVSRFLKGEVQTARTAAKLAKALGYSVRRYLVRTSEATASAGQ
jgi:transcriptional regulator with XRE-family HTH domain